MKLYKTIFVILTLFTSAIVMAGDTSAELDSVIQGTHRDAANVARDIYRHPRETLMFFDLQTDMKVLEILPGRGWYTEILAPLLKDKGESAVIDYDKNKVAGLKAKASKLPCRSSTTAGRA